MTAQMRKRSLLICLDIEPDEREVNLSSASNWAGFEATFELMQALRPRFRQATNAPVHYNWAIRMDPQIEQAYGSADWCYHKYESILRILQEEGDLIGLHVHPWRWDAPNHHWFSDCGDQAWVDYCVRLGFDAFRRTLGRTCPYFRFGDCWLNNATVSLLDRLGIPVDLTLEPGKPAVVYPRPHTGFQPDYGNVPRSAYRPNRNDHTKSGGIFRRRNIWMLPITTVDFNNLTAKPNQRNSTRLMDKNARLEGYIYSANELEISGWVYDEANPDVALSVDVWIDDQLHATLTADLLRIDLLEAGIGNGRHAFHYHVPAALRDDREHVVRVQVTGSSILLRNTPQSVVFRRLNIPDYQSLNLIYSPPKLQSGFDVLLADNKCPYITWVARSDIGIARHRVDAVEATLQFILDHPQLSNFTFDTCHETLYRMGITFAQQVIPA